MKSPLNIAFYHSAYFPTFLYVLAILLVTSCARMSSPSGGPKDEDPPVALKSKPINYATNFQGKKILVEFDEFVVLKNIRQELLVSPPLPEKPEIKQRGKTLVIKLNNELADSTTYNLNFYNSIVDLNENNPLKNFQFEFSTGSEFDSLYVGGIMHDAFNFSTEAGWYVMLYDKFDDSIPRTTLPNYVAKTDEDGKFFITNLKNKPYYIFGLKDMNNNMLFDLPNENLAFLDSAYSPGFVEQTIIDTLSIIKSISQNLKDTIRVDSLVTTKHMVTSVGDIRLYMFVEDFKQQYFKDSYRPEKQQLIFTFNQEIKDSFSLRPLSDTLIYENWFIKEPLPQNDSLIFWVTDTALYNNDSLSFQVNYTMKDSNQIDFIKTDTLLLVFKKSVKKEDGKKGVNKKDGKKEGGKFNLNFLNNADEEEVKEDTIIPPSDLTFTSNAKAPFDLNKPVELIARFPIKEIDKSRMQFTRIKDDTVKIPIEFDITQDENEFRKYIFNFEKDEEELFELFIPAGAITDIFGNINDTLKYKFKTRSLEYYATLSMFVVGVKEQAIIQLLDEKENVLRETSITSDTTLFYKYLAPSKFKFKLFYDSNGNGKWDTGNYKELKQAEQVFYYPFLPEILETKSNVDIENTWNLYPQNKDNHDLLLEKSKTEEH